MRGAAHAEMALEVGVDDAQRRPQPLRGDRPRHLGERQVGGHQRDAQTFALQQHHRQRRARPRSEIFGMAGELRSRHP